MFILYNDSTIFNHLFNDDEEIIAVNHSTGRTTRQIIWWVLTTKYVDYLQLTYLQPKKFKMFDDLLNTIMLYLSVQNWKFYNHQSQHVFIMRLINILFCMVVVICFWFICLLYILQFQEHIASKQLHENVLFLCTIFNE